MLTTTLRGWAIAELRDNGKERIRYYDPFISDYPDQAEVIRKVILHHDPNLKLRIVHVTVDIREESHRDKRIRELEEAARAFLRYIDGGEDLIERDQVCRQAKAALDLATEETITA